MDSPIPACRLPTSMLQEPLNVVCLAEVFWGTSYANRNVTLATDIKWPAASLHSSSQDNLAFLFGRLLSRRRNGVSEVWHSCISLKVFMDVMMNAAILSCSSHHWAWTGGENEEEGDSSCSVAGSSSSISRAEIAMKPGWGWVSRRQHLHSTIRRGRGEVHIFSYACFNMPLSLITSFSLQCVGHESTWNKNSRCWKSPEEWLYRLYYSDKNSNKAEYFYQENSNLSPESSPS